MSKFDIAVIKVLEHEGGYVDHPLDTGGATNFGITQRVYEQFLGRSVTKNEIRFMPINHAHQIYKDKYWNKVSGDKIKYYSIAFALFDNAVNRGPHRAINQARNILGQASIPFTEEGAYMPDDTLSLLNQADEMTFLNAFFDASEAAYRAIVRNNPSQEVFLKGWLKRVSDNRDYTGVNSGILNATSIGIGVAILALGIASFFLYRQLKGARLFDPMPIGANPYFNKNEKLKDINKLHQLEKKLKSLMSDMKNNTEYNCLSIYKEIEKTKNKITRLNRTLPDKKKSLKNANISKNLKIKLKELINDINSESNCKSVYNEIEKTKIKLKNLKSKLMNNLGVVRYGVEILGLRRKNIKKPKKLNFHSKDFWHRR
jgi:lysozyme family protein